MRVTSAAKSHVFGGFSENDLVQNLDDKRERESKSRGDDVQLKSPVTL